MATLLKKISYFLILACTSVGLVNASVLLDSLTKPIESAAPSNKDDWTAIAFRTDGHPYTLGNITLKLYAVEESPAVVLQIYNDGVSVPGPTLVGTLTPPSTGFSTFPDDATFTPNGIISLAKDTVYWVKLSNVDPDPTNGINWAYTLDVSSTEFNKWAYKFDTVNENSDGNPQSNVQYMIRVEAQATDGSEPPPANQPPIANAGADLTVALGSAIFLDGSASNDPDRKPNAALTFAWTQDSSVGPSVILNNANTAQASFTPTQTGIYLFSLTVNDGASSSAPDTIKVTVNETGPSQSPVTLISPNGGEIWPSKTRQAIQWSVISPLVNMKKPLTVQFSKNGGVKWATLFIKNKPKTGLSSWKILRRHVSDQGKVRVCAFPLGKKAKRVCDESDNTFQIIKN